MSASSNHDGTDKADPGAIYEPLGAIGYDPEQPQEKALLMHQIAPSISTSQPQVDATSIRWMWWVAGLGASIVLWAGIAVAFGAL